MINFIKLKHTTITQLVTILLTAAVGVGRATGWYSLPDSIIAGWGTLAAVLWAALGTRTVTSNARLVGVAKGSMSGVTVADVAAANGLVAAHDAAGALDQPAAPDSLPGAVDVSPVATADEIASTLAGAGLTQ